MAVEIKMPNLSQTTDEVKLVRWLVKEGDKIKKGDILCEVETDKVNMEVESFTGGTVEKLVGEPGSQIKSGSVIAVLGEGGEGNEEFPKTSEDSRSAMTRGAPGSTIPEKSLDYLEDMERKGKKEKLLYLYRKMLEIRSFEERIRFLFLEGKMPGTIHQYIGMEACAVGVCSALKKEDVIASTHRPHGHAIARGLSFNEIMAELYGRTGGCCRGKGGSMHIGNLEKGMLPAIAIVGGNLPVTVGMALSFKMKKEKRVAVSFFGDGASNEGSFHESLNMVAVLNVPAVFVCENNLYGASTSISKVTRIKNIADRADCYGIKGVIADGMDVMDVYRKAKAAVEDARGGNGPVLLELKTFRFCGHSRRDPSNYVPKEEKEFWAKKDPIKNFKEKILKESKVTEKDLEEIEKQIEKELDEAIEFAKNSPLPEPGDTLKDLYLSMEVPS